MQNEKRNFSSRPRAFPYNFSISNKIAHESADKRGELKMTTGLLKI